VLLAGAALLIESSRRLANVDPTVDVAHVLTASISLPATPNRRPASPSTDWLVRNFAAATAARSTRCSSACRPCRKSSTSGSPTRCRCPAAATPTRR
jgi:hypothetical protein